MCGRAYQGGLLSAEKRQRQFPKASKKETESVAKSERETGEWKRVRERVRDRGRVRERESAIRGKVKVKFQKWF